MFFRKARNNDAENSVEKPVQAPKAKKHWLKGFFKFLSILILFLIISLAGGLWWICQTESGQSFLVSTVNKFIYPEDRKEGLKFRISSLSGSLPFNFIIGLEAYDSKGLWLSAPENIFTLNWRELPSTLHLSALKLNNPDLLRFPDMPSAQKEPEPSHPLALKDIQDLLRKGTLFLEEKHWWLPEILLENIEIGNALLPPGLLPAEEGKTASRLATNLKLNASLKDATARTDVRVKVRDATSGRIVMPSLSFQELALDAALDFTAHDDKADTSLELKANVLDTVLDQKDIPDDLLGDQVGLNIKINANADTKPDGQTASLKLTGPNLDAGHITLHTNGAWQAGPEWKNGDFDGTASLSLATLFNPLLDNQIARTPDSPLAMVRKPIKLLLDADAILPEADLKLKLDAPEVAASGHKIENLALSVSSKNLDLPLPPAGMDLLEKEHHCDLALSGLVDALPVRMSTQAFFQARSEVLRNDEQDQKAGTARAWLASLRDLDLSALGLLARGNVSAYIPPGQLPALDGKLNLELAQWEAIQKFIPDQALSGQVKMDLHLDNPEARDPDKGGSANPSRQNLLLNLLVPTFAMRPVSGGQPVEVKDLLARVDLADVFKKPKLDLALNAKSLQAAGMKLNADIKAQGFIDGPLNADIKTGGDVNTKISASWSPGVATLKKCDVSLTLPPAMTPSGKAVPLAIKSENTAVIHYGDKGLAVENLDLTFRPSGRLHANGSLAPEKLAFNIKLDNVDFKPWQILAPQIPLGYANFSASLSGTPKTPGGKFDLVLKDVTLPGNPLPPFGIDLNGSIANASSGSALNLQLALDPKSLKALGCEKSRISARIPLIFGKDGIPNVNMAGPLAANINWDGALGPIWNLLPMADKRLNGRVNINMNAGGTIKSPRLQGGLAIHKARFEDLLLGILITDINLKMDLLETERGKKTQGALDNLIGAVKLSLNAGDGRGGTVNVSGDAALDGTNLDIKAKINRLRPLRRRDVHIELSGDATVVGSAMAPVINGQLIVNKGEVLLNNLEIMGSVTTLPISDGKPKKLPPPPEKAEKKEAGSINFKIDMLPRFTVEGRGLTSIWTAHLLISGSPFAPTITGDITSVKGNFDFLGKNFALTKGVVFFGGGSLSNPLVDMELTNETPDLTAHIIVSGPVSKIKLQLTSEPQLPRDEILSRVLFGRSVGDLSRFEALQLAAGVAQLAGLGSGDSFMSSAKKALGVDVLRLGTSASDAAGEPGDMTAGGTTIEMGKYINDMIYMGVQQGLQADSTAFIIQMELTPRTSLEIRTEQNNTWGGLKWKMNY